MKPPLGILSAACLLTIVNAAAAQNVPPFFGSGTAYDPQISTINSGAILDAQAVISDDRKHVTLNLRTSQNRLQSLIRVPVVSSSGGFVGGAIFNSEASMTQNAARQVALPAKLPDSPAAIERLANTWILTRQGMFLVEPLK